MNDRTPRSAAIERTSAGGGKEIERRHETASSAIAAQARAEIESRYTVALMRPRDQDNVRVRLLAECKRPSFAGKAWYQIRRKGAKAGKMTGTSGVVEGLSVRFAEAAIRIAGNIWQSTKITYDDDEKRLLNVAATDLETNASYTRDLIVEKTVERRRIPEGREDDVLDTRANADGEVVYLIASTAEELLTKESGLVSRVFRTEALRFIDAGTLDECERQIVETTRSADAKDPEAARKELADAFSTLAVLPADLKTYLGHDLGQCSPAELTSLRALFSGIRDGVTTWAEALAEKLAEEGKEAPAGKKTVAEKLADRKAERGRAPAQAAPAAASAGATPPQAAAAPSGRASGPSPNPVAPPGAPQAQGAPPAAGPGIPCAVCGKPVVDGVSTSTPTGPGIRHRDCPPFGPTIPVQQEPADAEPPAHVKTVGREPGEEG